MLITSLTSFFIIGLVLILNITEILLAVKSAITPSKWFDHANLHMVIRKHAKF
jgi:hypothetical protein